MAGLTASKKRKIARAKLLAELEEARRETARERRKVKDLTVVAVPESKCGDGAPVVLIPPSHDGRRMLISEVPHADRAMMRDFFDPPEFLSRRHTVLNFQCMTLITRLGTHVRWFMPIEER